MPAANLALIVLCKALKAVVWPSGLRRVATMIEWHCFNQRFRHVVAPLDKSLVMLSGTKTSLK